MAKNINDATNALKTLVLTITGMNDPGTTPPEQINDFPFVIIGPIEANWQPQSYDFNKGLHILNVQVHWPWRDLPLSQAEAKAYGDTIADLILDNPTLSGTVNAVNEVRAVLEPANYGALETFGWSFDVSVKIE